MNILFWWGAGRDKKHRRGGIAHFKQTKQFGKKKITEGKRAKTLRVEGTEVGPPYSQLL